MISRGYTLIEVLVVVLIIGIVTSLSFARFRDFQRRQQLSSVSRQVIGDLRDAQSSAGIGEKPNGCNGDLAGYEFRVLAGTPTRYEINAVCTAGTVQKKLVTIETISITPTNPVTFLPLAQGATFSGASPKRYTLRNTATNESIVIAISSTGEIYEQ